MTWGTYYGRPENAEASPSILKMKAIRKKELGRFEGRFEVAGYTGSWSDKGRFARVERDASHNLRWVATQTSDENMYKTSEVIVV